jgi:hypothetical protein
MGWVDFTYILVLCRLDVCCHTCIYVMVTALYTYVYCSALRVRKRPPPPPKCQGCCIVPGCRSSCALLSGHSPHIQHYCGETACTAVCSVPYCNRPCSHDHWHTLSKETALHDCGHSDHTCGRLRKHACSACGKTCCLIAAVPHGRHQCEEADSSPCVFMCWIPGCQNRCSSSDHFHGLTETGDLDETTVHFCGNQEHPCAERCQAPECNSTCTGSRGQPHTEHSCGHTRCFGTCSHPGCERVCTKADHHRKQHKRCDCGEPHACQHTCQAANCSNPCIVLDFGHVHHTCYQASNSASTICLPCPPSLQEEAHVLAVVTAEGEEAVPAISRIERKIDSVVTVEGPGCMAVCYVTGCQRRCKHGDHHHAPRNSNQHNCGLFHTCSKRCQGFNCTAPCKLDLTTHRY